MARTGTEVVKMTAVGAFLRYAPKESTEFFKARVESKNKEKVVLVALDGPRFKGGKEMDAFAISAASWDDRIKGMQGRQAGYSPSKKEEASPAPKAPAKSDKKDTAKPDKKGTAKPKNDKEEYDLESVKSELGDIIETIKDQIETLNDKLSAMENIATFLDGLQMGETSSPDSEEEPAAEKKSRRGGRSKPMNDEDEA